MFSSKSFELELSQSMCPAEKSTHRIENHGCINDSLPASSSQNERVESVNASDADRVVPGKYITSLNFTTHRSVSRDIIHAWVLEKEYV
ncbi:hypothetical protein AVEN_229146-1 [Araneus ventricosus]|uniref:Uncharacterized protein n=1 Tax=Araneus ventricosus TaxID=182803 RepID=A0A4Y2V6T3_ARAVE|nr:hypothetical protein AVEN_70683-1 [Araneus ventricosus]GBO19817.1 hypothetical protein AVEN_245146-1 [Araneus ventricosus]GBO19839.1 hypothetical protein AVEN_229146-1 [Araneus ventricosus]